MVMWNILFMKQFLKIDIYCKVKKCIYTLLYNKVIFAINVSYFKIYVKCLVLGNNLFFNPKFYTAII